MSAPAAAPLTLMAGARYVLSLWRPHWLQALLILALATVYLLFKTYVALAVKTLIDSLQDDGEIATLPFIVATLAVGFVVAFGARLVAEKRIARTGSKVVNHLRVRMFEHLQQLSQGFHGRTPTSNIVSRFSSDLVDLERAVGVRLRDAVFHLLEILYNYPVLFFLDWRLATLSLVLLAGVVVVISFLVPAATAAGYELKRDESVLAGRVQEAVRAQAVIRAFGFEAHALDRFSGQVATVEERATHANYLRARVSLAAKASMMASRLVLTSTGVLFVMNGWMGLGSLIAFLSLMELVNAATDDLVRNVLPDLIASTSGIQRVEELLGEQPDTVDRPDAVDLPPLQRAITFDGVGFGYRAGERQLDGVSLTIPAGASAAFVGASGSGKSTLLQLILRAHEPTDGSIRFDDVDLRLARRSSLQRQVGVVFQDTQLFDATIGDNIKMALPGATDADMERAARAAGIHDVIMQLPGRYQTPLGEAGGRLSGGQRQRVAIARAIIRDPAILILDEATSALDPATEQEINGTLAELGRSRTVIAVTHRLASVVDADRVFVLDHGRLVESGTHDELLAGQGRYAELWAKQTGFAVSADGRRAEVHSGYLRHVSLFSALPEASLDDLAHQFNSEYVGPGQEVIRQGDPGDKLYLIARGQVETLVRTDADQELRQIDVMYDGDHFGELALLTDAPRNATIRTLTGSLFLTLPKAGFIDLMRSSPEIRAAVEARMAETAANRDRLEVFPR